MGRGAGRRASREDFWNRPLKATRAVCYDILDVSARVLVTVMARASANPYPGEFERRRWREPLSMRCSSRCFPVMPPVARASAFRQSEFSSPPVSVQAGGGQQLAGLTVTLPPASGVPVVGLRRIPRGCALRSGSTSHPAFAHGTRNAVAGMEKPGVGIWLVAETSAAARHLTPTRRSPVYTTRQK